jgi:hypothetical protein
LGKILLSLNVTVPGGGDESSLLELQQNLCGVAVFSQFIAVAGGRVLE